MSKKTNTHHVVHNQRTEFKIHNLNGRIAESDSHGHDPRNIKG